MDRRKILLTLISKYFLLTLFAFFLYILESTPGFLQIFGVKPVFLIPYCIMLAMLDESAQTTIVFVIAGILFELSAGRLVGILSITVLLLCFCAMIAVKFFFKATYRNTIIFVFSSMLMIFTVDFIFSYMLRGYTGLVFIYFKRVVLLSLYSSIFSLLFYKFIIFINEKFKSLNAR